MAKKSKPMALSFLNTLHPEDKITWNANRRKSPNWSPNLSGADFSNRDMSGLWLNNCDLSESIFNGANISSTTFDGSDLSNAQMTGCLIDKDTTFHLAYPEDILRSLSPNSSHRRRWLVRAIDSVSIGAAHLSCGIGYCRLCVAIHTWKSNGIIPDVCNRCGHVGSNFLTNLTPSVEEFLSMSWRSKR